MEIDSQKTDVLIVGGGPAGASTALSLLNYSTAKVMLVEQSAMDQVRVGEHVSSSIFDLIEYLKIKKEDFELGSFIPAYSSTSFWGSDFPASTNAIFTTEHSTFQLDREKFDFKLIEQTSERGGLVFPRTKCVDFEQLQDKSWNVTLKHPEKETFVINATYLVDATGRKANVCRQLGVTSTKVDALMGLGVFLTPKDDKSLAHEQLLETTDLGWWYTALLPGNSMVATFFTDADIISKYRLDKSENWNKLLSKTKQVKHKVSGATARSSKLWIRDASTQISDSASRDNFIAVGDAASSFDPISSMGIGFAITSAFHAAKLIATQLKESTAQRADVYQQDILKNFDNYLTIRRGFYEKEKRWSDETFWKRRHSI